MFNRSFFLEFFQVRQKVLVIVVAVNIITVILVIILHAFVKHHRWSYRDTGEKKNKIIDDNNNRVYRVVSIAMQVLF